MRILIIGLGSIAKKHILALRELYPDCKIQALRSGEDPNANGVDGVDDIHALSEAAKPDFIIISNPTACHRDAIESVLNFKCPLFIEKPLFGKAGEKEAALVELLSKNRHPTYVACNLRFHPVIAFLKRTLRDDADKIDEVSVYCGSFLPLWRPCVDFRSNYSSDPDRGGGVHLDLIHEMDYVCHLFGNPDVVRSVRTNKSSLDIPAADSARYFLGYRQFSVAISLNYFRKVPLRSIEIVREKDILQADLLRASVKDQLTGAILFEEPGYSMAQSYKAQMKYFIESKASSMMNDAAEAFHVLKLALS